VSKNWNLQQKKKLRHFFRWTIIPSCALFLIHQSFWAPHFLECPLSHIDDRVVFVVLYQNVDSIQNRQWTDKWTHRPEISFLIILDLSVASNLFPSCVHRWMFRALVRRRPTPVRAKRHFHIFFNFIFQTRVIFLFHFPVKRSLAEREKQQQQNNQELRERRREKEGGVRLTESSEPHACPSLPVFIFCFSSRLVNSSRRLPSPSRR
jgi:hypothetical protein